MNPIVEGKRAVLESVHSSDSASYNSSENGKK